MAIPIRYDRAAILHVHPHKKNARRHSPEGTSPRTSVRVPPESIRELSSCENMVTSHRVGITHAFRLVLILSLSLLWFFVNAEQGSACSCVRAGSPSEELAQSTCSLCGQSLLGSFNVPQSNGSILRLDPTTVGFEVSILSGRVLLTQPRTLRSRDRTEAADLGSPRAKSTSSILTSAPVLACAVGLPCARMQNPTSTSWERDHKPQPGTKGPMPGTPEFPPQQSPEIEWVDPASGGCGLGSSLLRRGVARHHGRPGLVRCTTTASLLTDSRR